MNEVTINRFFEAACNDNIDLIKLMLCSGIVHVNDQNDYGSTALMLACFRNNTKIVTLLLSHKDIDVNIKDKYGKTALTWACYKDNVEIVKLLLSHKDIDVNIKDETEGTVFIYTNDREIRALLIEAGAKI